MAYAPIQSAFPKVGKPLVQLLLVVFSLLMVSGSLNAQPIGGEQKATREELSSQLAAAEQRLATGSVRGSARERLAEQIAALKSRLEVGDFKVGDRFVVTRLFGEEVSTDTASVRDGHLVAIFNLPDMSLKGVLRSELDERLASHVARYLKGATVRANVLTRVGIFGAVARPGHYQASPDRPISELVMLAGGPRPDARLDQLEIKRAGKTILRAKDSKQAIKEGMTLEQLDVQSGDEVNIPQKRGINWQLVLRLAILASSLFFAFVQFIQWYYGREQ